MSIFSSLFDWLKSFFTDLLQMLEGSFLWVFAVVLPTFALLGLAYEQIASWLTTAAVWIWDAAGNLLESLWGSCIGLVEGAIEWIIEIAGEVIDFVVEEIVTIANAVGEVLANTLSSFLTSPGGLMLLAMAFFFLMKGKDTGTKFDNDTSEGERI
jgi:predicted PurR-regulated permease PerM